MKKVIINKKWTGATFAIIAQGDDATGTTLAEFARTWDMSFAYIGGDTWVAIASDSREIPETAVTSITSDLLGGTKWTSTVMEEFPDGGNITVCTLGTPSCPEGGML